MNRQMMNPIVLWPTVVLLAVASVADLRSRRIPNLLVVPFLILGLGASALVGGWNGLGLSLLGVTLATATFGIFCYLGGMGMGDVKLGAAVGAWIGPSQLSIALVMTGLVGGVMALGWALAGGFLGEALGNTAGLVLGRRRGLTLGNPLAHKMPYAPAIAIGTLLSFLGGHI